MHWSSTPRSHCFVIKITETRKKLMASVLLLRIVVNNLEKPFLSGGTLIIWDKLFGKLFTVMFVV